MRLECEWRVPDHPPLVLDVEVAKYRLTWIDAQDGTTLLRVNFFPVTFHGHIDPVKPGDNRQNGTSELYRTPAGLEFHLAGIEL